MFFTEKEERNKISCTNKYNELNDRFLSLTATSLEGTHFIKLSRTTLKKHHAAYIEMHPIYTDMLNNIDDFINEIILERLRNRLSPTDKEKVIEKFIIPLYELKKTIYGKAIDCVHKSVRKLYEQCHPYKYKNEAAHKYIRAKEEFNREIKICNESINAYKPVSCTRDRYCNIL